MGLQRASDIYTKTASSGVSETEHILRILESKRRGGKRFRPFAGDVAYCSRKNWFHANVDGGESITPATLNLYQGVGNGVEERIVSGLEAHGQLLGSQVSLPNPDSKFKVNVGGYIDAIGLDGKGNLAAFEIKTTGAMPSQPKLNHLSQAMTYACLGGLDTVYIIYVGRQVQNFPDPSPLVKAFLIDVKNLLSQYMTNIVMSCHALKSLEAPQRPPTFRKSSECQYCDFVEMCWKDASLKTMSPSKNAALVAGAEKTAQELITMRPAFLHQLLLNCEKSCPEGQENLLSELQAKAQKQVLTLAK